MKTYYYATHIYAVKSLFLLDGVSHGDLVRAKRFMTLIYANGERVVEFGWNNAGAGFSDLKQVTKAELVRLRLEGLPL